MFCYKSIKGLEPHSKHFFLHILSFMQSFLSLRVWLAYSSQTVLFYTDFSSCFILIQEVTPSYVLLTFDLNVSSQQYSCLLP